MYEEEGFENIVYVLACVTYNYTVEKVQLCSSDVSQGNRGLVLSREEHFFVTRPTLGHIQPI
jgi:hypothetical protein